jgi:hypothetical protein
MGQQHASGQLSAAALAAWWNHHADCCLNTADVHMLQIVQPLAAFLHTYALLSCDACALQLSRPKESRDLHRLARVAMWTKLRPGVREFLRRAAERFELWIYTAGSKAYADVSDAISQLNQSASELCCC